MAVRRRCPTPCGQAGQSEALTRQRSPAPSRTLIFIFSVSSFTGRSTSAATAAAAAPSVRRHHSRHQLSSASLLHHYNASTRAPATHRIHSRSLTALGKPHQRARARRSIPAAPVTVAGAPPSTFPCISLCVEFVLGSTCSSELELTSLWPPPA